MGYKITMIQEPSEMKKQKKREYFMESWTEIQLKDKRQYLRRNLKKFRPAFSDLLCLCVLGNKDILFLLVKGRLLWNGDFYGLRGQRFFHGLLREEMREEVEITSLHLLFPQLPRALLWGAKPLTP